MEFLKNIQKTIKNIEEVTIERSLLKEKILTLGHEMDEKLEKYEKECLKKDDGDMLDLLEAIITTPDVYKDVAKRLVLEIVSSDKIKMERLELIARCAESGIGEIKCNAGKAISAIKDQKFLRKELSRMVHDGFYRTQAFSELIQALEWADKN